MEAVAAIIAFALFLGVVYLIIRPFLAPEEIYDEAVNSPELVGQKNRVIGAIREIDMDYQTGKLSEEDYQLLRSRYTAAAAEIIRRMDEEATPVAQQERAWTPEETSTPPQIANEAADDEVERMIADRKAALKESR